MSEQHTKRKSRKRKTNKVVVAILSLLIVAAMSVCAVGAMKLIESMPKKGNDEPSTVSTVSVEPEPEPIVKVASATIASTGDLLMHMPIITGAYDNNTKTYDFSKIYTYLGKYSAAADYAVANLETTLRGTEDGAKYSGYPTFNCPDSIVTATKNAGFDMLLTANNHSYDKELKGFLRTLDVIDSEGIDRIGTMKTEEEPKYTVKDINGIKIGMTCYTYETETGKEGRKALNGIMLATEATNLINSFSYERLDAFYTDLKGQLDGMKAQGAEATVVYIHWGDEYRLTANKKQIEIAQQLCNLGVDVIVGGHAHVVEPIDLLTSETDPDHKTVCLYSMGNAVSNQRKERASIKTGHTEDGVLFSITFAKYSDGTVLLESTDILPTWVNMFTSKATGKLVYQIIPLDKNVADWKTEFDLTDTSLGNAEKSYDRTIKIVGDGLDKVKEYLKVHSVYPAVPKADPGTSDISDISSLSPAA